MSPGRTGPGDELRRAAHPRSVAAGWIFGAGTRRPAPRAGFGLASDDFASDVWCV